MVDSKSLEAGIQIRFHVFFGHPRSIHGIEPGMSALGRKNEAIPAFVFTQPSPEEFFAAMTSTGKPSGVNFGGI
jgi:hypothetical protein